jgi:hypothetical protein
MLGDMDVCAAAHIQGHYFILQLLVAVSLWLIYCIEYSPFCVPGVVVGDDSSSCHIS